eukprot:403373395
MQVISGTNLPMTPPKQIGKQQQHANNGLMKDVIIHRTSNAVFVNDNQDYLKRKEEREKNIRDKGWNAPTDRPYQQFGDFANVLQAIEGIKMNLPHTKGSLDMQTHKNIKVMKRINETSNNFSSSSSFAQQLVEPGRTVKILNQYQGQLRKLRAVSQVSQLNNTNPLIVQQGSVQNSGPQNSNNSASLFNRKRYSNQDNITNKSGLGGKIEDEEDEHEEMLKEQHYVRLKNTRLHTSSLKKLINQSNDGGSVLKSEIAESYQRVKAVKHGMLIQQIMQNAYKDSYSINQQKDMKKRRESADTASEVAAFKLQPIIDNDNTFLTGIKEKPSQSSHLRFSNISTAPRTQASSPSKFYSQTKMDLNNKDSKKVMQNSFQFQPEQIIFIPNYQNKKAKIIRVNDLAKLKNGFLGGRSNLAGDGSVLASNKNGNQGFQDMIANTGGQNYNSNTAINSNFNNKKSNSNVNYHKKLQDEFERYEQVFKEHFVTSNKDLQLSHITSNQETPRNGQLINSLISNQFMSKQNNNLQQSTYLSPQNSYINGVTPKRGMSRDESQQSEGQNPFLKANNNKFKGKKSSILVKNESQTPMQTNNTIKNGINKQQYTFNMTAQKKNTISNQNTSLTYTNQNSSFQKGQPRAFEQRLSKQEREQILISAITNSIKYQSEQDEQKLLEMLNEDQLFKECSQLLKDYFQINFLNEIKDNKVMIFRLYKLYLLHSLSLNFRQIDENQNQANNVQYFKRHQRPNQNGQIEEVVSIASDSSDEDQNYRGESGTGAFKQKMSGFIRLLQEILSPAEKESLELDSVFQLKSLVKSYYEKKGVLAENLTETLYAMMCERPQIMDAKKRNFFNSYEEFDNFGSQVKKIRNLYFELEQMRLKAEKERITNYRELIEQILSQNQMSPQKKTII